MGLERLAIDKAFIHEPKVANEHGAFFLLKPNMHRTWEWWWKTLVSLALVDWGLYSSFTVHHSLLTFYRTLDGRLNNIKDVFLGAAGENLIRLAPNAYVDGISIPTGACTPKQLDLGTCPFPDEFSGLGSNRPNARVISNTLLRQVILTFFTNYLVIQ